MAQPLAPAQLDDSVLIKMKTVKLACLKALGVMMSNNLAKNCLTSSAVAATILKHYQIPHAVVVGYTTIPGLEVSTPHVWLETPGDLLTDLTFSGPYRAVAILGQSFEFHEEARKPVYTAEPQFPLPQKTLPVDVLISQAKDLDGYLAGAPQFVRDHFAEIMTKALDGSDKVEFRGVSADILSSVA